MELSHCRLWCQLPLYQCAVHGGDKARAPLYRCRNALIFLSAGLLNSPYEDSVGKEAVEYWHSLLPKPLFDVDLDELTPG